MSAENQKKDETPPLYVPVEQKPGLIIHPAQVVDPPSADPTAPAERPKIDPKQLLLATRIRRLL